MKSEKSSLDPILLPQPSTKWRFFWSSDWVKYTVGRFTGMLNQSKINSTAELATFHWLDLQVLCLANITAHN